MANSKAARAPDPRDEQEPEPPPPGKMTVTAVWVLTERGGIPTDNCGYIAGKLEAAKGWLFELGEQFISATQERAPSGPNAGRRVTLQIPRAVALVELVELG